MEKMILKISATYYINNICDIYQVDKSNFHCYTIFPQHKIRTLIILGLLLKLNTFIIKCL